MIILSLAQPLGMYQQAIFFRQDAIAQETKKSKVQLRDLAAPLFLFFTLLLQIWFRVEIVSKGYELQVQREKALRQDSELRQLNLDLAVLTHSKNLGEEAAKLGLSAPVAKQIREIKE